MSEPVESQVDFCQNLSNLRKMSVRTSRISGRFLSESVESKVDICHAINQSKISVGTSRILGRFLSD